MLIFCVRANFLCTVKDNCTIYTKY